MNLLTIKDLSKIRIILDKDYAREDSKRGNIIL